MSSKEHFIDELAELIYGTDYFTYSDTRRILSALYKKYFKNYKPFKSPSGRPNSLDKLNNINDN